MPVRYPIQLAVQQTLFIYSEESMPLQNIALLSTLSLNTSYVLLVIWFKYTEYNNEKKPAAYEN